MTTKTLPDSTTATYTYSGSGVTLVNAGVQGAPGASGLNFGFVVAGDNDTLINNGTVFGQRVGIYVTGSLDSVINAAGKQITATLPVQGGVNVYNFSGTVTNYGTISGYANAVNGSGGNAVELRHGGLVTNFGTLLNGGVLVRVAVGTVVNSGVILGNNAYGGVYMNVGGQVTNLSGGLISANGATVSYDGAPPYGVFIHGGAGTVTNAGTIDGNTGYAVELATGFQNQVIVDPGAVFVGTVDGGTAADATLELASSASTGTLSGFGTQFTNFSTVTFDTSASWLFNTSLGGTSAAIDGFGAGDTIDLTGFAAVSDTFASNSLVLTNAGSMHATLHIQGTFTTSNFTRGNDGSGGTDLVFNAATAVALAYGQTIDEAGIVATSETVTAGVMTLFTGGNNAVGTIAVGTSLSTGDFSLQPDGSGGTDVVVQTATGTYTSGLTLLVNPTTIASTAQVANSTASIGAITGPAGTAWTLTNLGIVTEGGASGRGISLAAEGTITNAVSGMISAALGIDIAGGTGLVANQGTIIGTTSQGVYLAAAGTVSNAAGAAITGGSAGVVVHSVNGSVTNLGQITATVANGSAISLSNGGIIVNGRGGAGTSTASLQGAFGIRFTTLNGPNERGTLTNFGTITGTGSLAAAVVQLAGGAVYNGESGATAALIQGVQYAIDNSGIVGLVANLGTIKATGTLAGGYGIQAGGGTVTNLGSTALIEGHAGIRLTANGTVTNAGTIESNLGTAGIAVTFGTGTNRLIADPGAVFIGSVSANPAGTSVVELASASGAGMLASFGGSITNFSSLVFDPGAQWTVAGNGSASGLGTLGISGFTAGDTIDLTDFAAASRTFTSNSLVLGDGVGDHATLAIQGSFSTADFIISSDGNGGTDITEQNVLVYGDTADEAGIVAASETVTDGIMTLFNSGSTAVGTINVGTTLSTGDFVLISDGSGGTDVIVNAVFGTYANGVTLLVNPTTIASAAEISGSLAGATGVYGPSGAAWTLTNQGAVSETGAGSYGISFASAGTITNAASAIVAGYKAGIIATTDPVTVVNSGGVGSYPTASGGAGIILAAGGVITNQSGGTISGYDGVEAVNDAATVTNAGSIAGNYSIGSAAGVYLSAGGSVTNQSTGTIYGRNDGVLITGGRGTVVNLGYIHTPDGSYGNDGVYLGDGGVVINGASGGTASTATILGYGLGVQFGGSAAGTLINYGTVNGNPGRPAVVMAYGVIINGVSGATGALIESGDQTNAIVISGAGTVINYGSIVGRENYNDRSVFFGISLGGNGSIASTISNLGAQSLITDYVAVYAGQNSTVTNAGTMAAAERYGGSAKNAVIFGGGTNRLIIDPGAVFIGTVHGSGPVTLTPPTNVYTPTSTVLGIVYGVGSTTLELASGASAGTLTGLGTEFTNFASLVFDSGAQWTATGNDAADGLGTLGIGGFTFGDTIDLTGFHAVNRTFASNSLVLGDGVGDYASLAIQGSFYTNIFHLTNDGSGGTDLDLQPDLHYAQTIDEAGIVATSETVTAGVMTLQNGATAVATVHVGPSLSSGDFSLQPDGSGGTDLVVHTATGTYTGGITLLVNPTTISSAATISDTVASGIGVTGPAGTNWTVTNLGTVGEAGASSIGISLASAGTIINAAGGIVAGAQDGVGLADGGFVSAQAGGTIAGIIGVAISGGTATVVNAGSVRGNLTSGAGISLTAGGSVTNQAGGTISGSYGIVAVAVAATAVNAGSIGDGASLPTGAAIALKDGGSITNQSGGKIIAGLQGIYFGGAAGTLVNAGSIGGGPASGNGIIFVAGGLVSNQSGGAITGRYGVRAVIAAVTVTNDGSIGGNLTSGAGLNLAAGGALSNQSGGVITGFAAVYGKTSALTVVNASSIGGNAVSGSGIRLAAGGSVTNLSTGTITGFDGILTAGGATVVNAGSVGGTTAMALGAGATNRLVFDPGAIFTGRVDGGNTIGATFVSTLELASGASGGTLSGLGTTYLDFAQVTIDTNAGWTLSGGNTLVAGATLINNGTLTASGTLINGGTIAGDALLLSGGALTNQAGGSLNVVEVYGVAAAGVDNVVNQGTIASDTGFAVNLAAAGNVSNASGGLISGYEGVRLTGTGATLANAGQITASATGAGYGVFVTQGGLVTNALGGSIAGYTGVAISGGTGTVENLGTITGTAKYGVKLTGGGAVTNAVSGTITGSEGVYITGSGTGSVGNDGTILGTSDIGVYLKTAGNLSNAAGALIGGYGNGVKLKGTDATLSNLGQITGTAASNSYGAYLRNGGLVTNGQGGSGPGTASIQGYTGLTFKTADVVNAYGTLINYGTILGTGSEASGVALSNAGTVFNGQGGATAALIEGGRYGVSSGQGPVVNYATITATGTAGGNYGVAIQGTGNVSNLGSAALIEGYGGVLIGTDGTVTNEGTIASNQGTSGVAVHFTGGDARLVDDPGAVFAGSIYGGGGGTAVMELASSSSAGTLAGFGTSVTNFTSLVFDPGAQWMVAGNDAADGLGTLGIGGFTSGDTIDLTGFAATSRAFASDSLVLTDSGGAHQTLNVQGSFTTANFLISSDGSGGTDITFGKPPTIAAGGTVTFTGGGSPVILNSGLTVTDSASATLAGATIWVGTGFISGDLLNSTNTGSITGAFDASTGTLTLSGTDTVADYQAALDSITYSFTADGDPTRGGGNTSRTIDWVATNGTAASAAATSTLDTVHVAPTITAGGTVSFIGGGSAVTLDATLSLGDPDSGDLLNSGTVSIEGFVSGDILQADTTGVAVTASYDALTGVLTLGGSDTLADYQAVLRSVTFRFNPADGDPTGGGGAISSAIDWTINDGSSSNGVSNTGTSTLEAVHVPPAVTAGGTVTFAGGDEVIVLDPTLTLSDPNSGGNLTGATITIASGHAAADALLFSTQHGITGSYDSSGGVLTLSGTTTIENYQAALESITYSVSPSDADPTNGGGDTGRTIDWVVTDGNSNGISNTGSSMLETVHTAPAIAAGGTVTFASGGAAVVLDSEIGVTDPDSGGSLTGATITIGSGHASVDLLNFSIQNGITGSYDGSGGVLTLTGTATIAEYQAALESITYSVSPSNADPTNGSGDTNRTIDWVVTDGSSSNGSSSNTGTSTLDTVHVAPSINTGGMVTFTGGGSAVVLDSEIGITDSDSAGNLTGATISIDTASFVTGDLLNFTNQFSITGTYDGSSGVLTLSGTATIDDYQTALTSISYSVSPSDADPTNGGTDTSRTIDWVVSDGSTGSGISNTGSSTLDLVHVAPTIAVGGTVTFTGGGAAVVLDPSVSITDIDSSGSLAGAEVTIGSGFVSGDNLNFTDALGITGTYDSSSGTLTLSGAATLGDYETALESVAYSFAPANGDPTNGDEDTSRTIGWAVSDGVLSSNNASTSLAIEHVAPTITASGTVSYATGGNATVLDATATVIDADSAGFLSSGTVAVSGARFDGDGGVLNADTAGTSITLNYNPITEVLTLTGTDTLAHYQQVLDSVGFSSTALDPTNGGDNPTRTISWTVGDAADRSVTATSTLDVTRLPPVIGDTAGGQIISDEATLDPFAGATISDPNSGQTEAVTITLSNAANGTLSNLGGGSFDNGTYAVTGTALAVTGAIDGLVFTPTTHQVVPGSSVTTTFTIKATDTNGVSAADSTTTVVATAVNDPPTITHTAANVGVPNQVANTPFAGITISDPDVGHIDTVAVTLSDAAGGTLSNLGGGSFDPTTGVYTVSGTPGAVTVALDALVFTPSLPATGFVSTTTFTIGVTGPGGSAGDSSISVTSVQQVLSLAGTPTSDDVISASPDGSDFAAPTEGKTNQAAITDPASDGMYVLPSGYQAEFLGGTADAALTDTSGGNALLVGNSGNDTLVSGMANDTIGGGTGQNLVSVSGAANVVEAATGTDTIFATGNLDTVVAAGTARVSATGASQIVDGSFDQSAPGVLSLLATGDNDTVSAGTSALNATVNGDGAIVYGGFGSVAGGLNVSIGGSNDTINPGGSAATIKASGNSELLYGSYGSVAGGLNVSISGSNDTVNPGASAATVTATGDSELIYGTFGSAAGGLHVSISGSGDTVSPGADPATVVAAGSDDLIDGTFGSVSGGLNVSISGSNDTVNPGVSSATVNVSGNDDLVYGTFGSVAGGLNVWLGGSNDTVNPGIDPATVSASGNGDLIFGIFGSIGGGLNVSIGGSNDTVEPGNSAATITAGASSNELWIYAGSASLDFTNGGGSATVAAAEGNVHAAGGSGSLVFIGGPDNSTVVGGLGGTMLYGAASSAITYSGNAGSAVYIAGNSNETLNAAGSSTNDTIIAGSGSATFTGGSGSDSFVFYQDLTAAAGGGHDVIAGFTSNDVVHLSGYGANAAANALDHAVYSGGNTTMTLSDNTQITFLNIAAESVLAGHVLSV